MAGGSLGCLAIDRASLHGAKSEEQADDTRLSEALGLQPSMMLWASLAAEAATGEPKVPSLSP